MNTTPYDDVNQLLNILLTQIQSILHDKLVGLYLYGSLVSGDFDHDISDIDVLAATTEPVDEPEFEALKTMHDDIAREYKKWNDRIEVQYVSRAGLKTCKTEKSTIVTISPGEPIHSIEAGKDWLLNWYVVQEKGIVLFGPKQSSLIPKITKEECVTAVKKDALLWRDRIKKYTTQSPRGPLAYVVFTLCRELYGYKHGEQVSKQQAASWAAKEFPEWQPLIDDAITWRTTQWDKEQKSVGSALTTIISFVNFSVKLVTKL